MLMLADDLGAIVPSEVHHLLESDYGKLVIVIALEHVLLAVKFIMSGVANLISVAART
jgi:hypothetical protein